MGPITREDVVTQHDLNRENNAVIDRLRTDLAAARAENERLQKVIEKALFNVRGSAYWRAIACLDAALATPAEAGSQMEN